VIALSPCEQHIITFTLSRETVMVQLNCLLFFELNFFVFININILISNNIEFEYCFQNV